MFLILCAQTPKTTLEETPYLLLRLRSSLFGLGRRALPECSSLKDLALGKPAANPEHMLTIRKLYHRLVPSGNIQSLHKLFGRLVQAPGLYLSEGQILMANLSQPQLVVHEGKKTGCLKEMPAGKLSEQHMAMRSNESK